MIQPIIVRTLALLSAICFSFTSYQLLELSGSNSPENDEQSDTVVARIGSRTITMSQLDALIQADLRLLNEEIYSLRQRGLDYLVNEATLQQEAQRVGVTTDQLRKQLTDSVEVEESEVQRIFVRNRSRFLEQSEFEAKENIRNDLLQERKAQAYREFLQQLRAQAQVELYLAYPESLLVNVNIDGDPILGNEEALVTIIQFSDFQCPYCDQSRKAVKEILDRFGSSVRFVHKDLPLNNGPNSFIASLAAECAHQQRRFWEYYTLLFDNRKDHSEEALIRYAAQLDFDVSMFRNCLNMGQSEAAVEADLKAARNIGANSTPILIINRRMLRGSAPLEVLISIVDEELERAR